MSELFSPMNTALIIVIVSLILLITGIYLWQRGNYLLKNGKKAEAIILKNNFHSDADGGGTYHPVVWFLTDKQVWITQELNIGFNPPRREGAQLQVIYDPEDPTKVEINSTLYLEVLPRLLVALGIVGLVFGALQYLDVISVIPS